MKTYKLLNIGRYCSAAAVFTFMLFVGDMLMQTIKKKVDTLRKTPMFSGEKPRNPEETKQPRSSGKKPAVVTKLFCSNFPRPK